MTSTTSIVLDPILIAANSVQDPLEPPLGGAGGDQSKESCRLSIIAKHKKMGPKSLNMFKEEVKRYATEHTFKVNKNTEFSTLQSIMNI